MQFKYYTHLKSKSHSTHSKLFSKHIAKPSQLVIFLNRKKIISEVSNFLNPIIKVSKNGLLLKHIKLTKINVCTHTHIHTLKLDFEKKKVAS